MHFFCKFNVLVYKLLLCLLIEYASGNHLCKEGRKSEHEQLNFQSWMDDEDLEIGTVGVLDNEEATFWKEFIQQYLKPLELEEKDEKKVLRLIFRFVGV